MDIQSWWLFASIALIAALTPGPAFLLVTSHSLNFGWKRAVLTILGNISGLFVLSALSILGLSVIILSSSIVYSIIKFLGALYLVYLGIKIWRKGFLRVSDVAQGVPRGGSGKKCYFQGLILAISNPKAIAFTTALFPQFINHEAALGLQFTILVMTFMLLSFCCLVFYAYAAERTHSGLLGAVPGYLNKGFGLGFIASGIVLATASSR